MSENIVPMEKTLVISIGESRHATSWQPKRVSWDELCNRMSKPTVTQETMAEYEAMTPDQRSAVKDVGGFVGGVLDGEARKSETVKLRQLITLDADFAQDGMWEDWEMLVGNAAIMHTTHSHTPLCRRLRLLVPLTRPVDAEEYEPIARRIAQWLDIDAFDDTTYQPARLMYWPSRSKDAHYGFKCSKGPWVNPDDVLATYNNWRDMREWPVSIRRQKVIRKMGERQGDPITKPGVVGAFNRVYSITEAIVKFLPDVYAPCGNGRWTYTKGSTVGGAVSYDDDTFLYSHHDTDPTSERLCNAFDLVRIHLFGERDKGAPDDNLSDLPSTAAMRALCAQDDAVRAELLESIKCDPSEPFDSMVDLQRFSSDLTEQGTALDFSDRYGSNIRHCNAFGWMFWDGAKWQLGADAEVHMLTMHYSDDLYGQARTAAQTAEDKAAQARAEAMMKHAVRLRSSAGQLSLLRQVASQLHEPSPESYDASEWDLNTPDGIVDLRTGAVRAHDPKAKCTKITRFSVEPNADAAEWLGFIDYITNGDVDFANYLQQLAGMAVIGKVFEEGLVISYGQGGNGKSTLFGALRSVLGDYARGVNPDVLVTASGSTDQSYIAALRGCRLAIMSETEEGARFGIAQMKRITSRDVISARMLYKDPIEFEPTHTTVMHTNHLPRLNSLDGGTKRRIAVAPFNATRPLEKVITNYEQKLVEQCGPAIMNWIVEGAKKFYDAGCKLLKPACVQAATEQYLADEDWLAQYIDERCDICANATVGLSELLSDYKSWAERNGEYVRKRNDFITAMESRGFTRRRSSKNRYWLGLKIRESDEL